MQSGRRSSGSNDSSEAGSEQIWHHVFTCVRQVGAKLNWSLAQHFTADCSREVILQHVQSAMKNISTGAPMDTDDMRMELFYVTATLFLHALHEYTTNVKQGETFKIMIIVGS